MILLVHVLFGAAIGSSVTNIPLAIVLAFLGHYLLDLLPHIEYPIENIEKKQWRKALPDILRIIADLLIGILLILIFSKSALPAGRQAIIYICAFMGILPDGFSVLSYFISNKILKTHNKIHQKIHFLKDKKISNFWRFSSQIFVIIISTILLKN